MNRKELQLILKQYQLDGYHVQVKLNASTEVLQAEANRIEATKPVFKSDETLKVSSNSKNNEQRDLEQFNKAYKQGLADERLVIEFMKQQGFEVTDSTDNENKTKDIDCYIDGIPTSIKAQHKGLKYNNIYFELEQQLTSTKNWVPSWYYTSRAEQYLILQGNTLRLYKKDDIKKHATEIGWSHTRRLSPEAKSTQGGSYRYCDARLGFLKPTDVEHSVWVIA